MFAAAEVRWELKLLSAVNRPKESFQVADLVSSHNLIAALTRYATRLHRKLTLRVVSEQPKRNLASWRPK